MSDRIYHVDPSSIFMAATSVACFEAQSRVEYLVTSMNDDRTNDDGMGTRRIRYLYLIGIAF